MLRPQLHSRPSLSHNRPRGFCFLGNLEPFTAPDSLYSVLTDIPASFTQLDRDAPIAIPAIAVGKCDDGLGQFVFILLLCGLITLRATWQVNQVAPMTLTLSALPCMLQSGTPTLRA
jgi:hypothetical protein